MLRRIFIIAFAFSFIGCTKAMVGGEVAGPNRYYTKSFKTTKEEAYYALRWAMKINGYALSMDDKADAKVETVWMPVTSRSHYLDIFDREDYGVNGAYHQLIGYATQDGDRVVVKIGSRTKSIVSNLKSSGVEEEKVMNQVGDFLRKNEPDVTNLGLEE